MCHQSRVDERVHIYNLTYGQSIICFYMMGLGANFTMREVAYSANSYANCHHDIYQDTFSTEDTQFLWVIGFHGFILIVFSLLDSSVSSQNLVFPFDRCQEGVLHVSKKGGISRRGAGVKKEEPDAPFCTMIVCPLLFCLDVFNTLSLSYSFNFVGDSFSNVSVPGSIRRWPAQQDSATFAFKCFRLSQLSIRTIPILVDVAIK